MGWASRLLSSRQRLLTLWTVLTLFALESLIHINSFKVSRPSKALDTPFHTRCQEPNTAGPRENAVIVMLARNSELETATRSVASLERHFNRWYHYPIVFLNDVGWDQAFIDAVTEASSGQASFEVIPKDLWGYPEWINQGQARSSMAQQESRGLLYSGLESYHHMCRFNSGCTVIRL